MIQQKSQPNDTLTTFDSQILATAANYFYTAQSSSTRQFTSTECEAEQTAKANVSTVISERFREFKIFHLY